MNTHLLRLLILIVFGLPLELLAQQQPNIIYIMTDDMGYGDLSGYGRKGYATPNLDKLAAQGMKFVNAYAAGPLCTPTRVGFLTGCYPARTPVGLMEPLTGSKHDISYGLTDQIPSLGTLVKNASYQTALIGKWHLGVQPEHSPVKNGFEYFFGFRSGSSDYISHKGDLGNHDLWENDSPVYPQGYLTELISEKAVSYISTKHSKPFFLVINFNAPHWPWQGPNDSAYPDSLDYRAGGSAETYAAMMKSLDDGVGKIMAAVDRYASSNTVVIFTNDNGGERFSDNGGLSQAKGTLWEGGIRVPAFVRWPEKITPGSVTNQVAVTMDWTATILALAGAKAVKTFPLDGINLIPVLTKKTGNIERTLYWRTSQRTKQKAMRMGDWKYLQDEKGEYLFNLADDQQEKNDLKEENATVFSSLKQKYAAWEKSVPQPLPLVK
ncbi:MAG TPA: sulfatase-like hydrolase/transferase [Cyclobacteriaceae bacterium]|nr:sulfatase-like hydrolase/transferase [Cyclobacteriaceae bacterium]